MSFIVWAMTFEKGLDIIRLSYELLLESESYTQNLHFVGYFCQTYVQTWMRIKNSRIIITFCGMFW